MIGTTDVWYPAPQHVRLVLLFLRCRDGRWGGGHSISRCAVARDMYVCMSAGFAVLATVTEAELCGKLDCFFV